MKISPMKNTGSPLVFPCAYLLKILGENTNEFYAAVTSIMEKHIAEGETVLYNTRTSSGGKYLSITATFTIHSQEQLTAIYQELSKHKSVLMIM
jgi:hypothetical protein